MRVRRVGSRDDVVGAYAGMPAERVGQEEYLAALPAWVDGLEPFGAVTVVGARRDARAFPIDDYAFA